MCVREEELICPACGEEMTFVGEYLIACQNPDCDEFDVEYDIDGPIDGPAEYD